MLLVMPSVSNDMKILRLTAEAVDVGRLLEEEEGRGLRLGDAAPPP